MGSGNEMGVVPEKPNSAIAALTKQAAYLASFMIVVNRESRGYAAFLPADGAHPALRAYHLCVLLLAYAVPAQPFDWPIWCLASYVFFAVFLVPFPPNFEYLFTIICVVASFLL